MEKNIREILKDNLNYYLKNSQLSQKEIADRLGISKGSITNWLVGSNSPSIETLAKLCQILGVKMSEMLSDKVEITPSEKALLDNYNKLNKAAQNTLVKYSAFMASQPENLKNNSQIDKINA